MDHEAALLKVLAEPTRLRLAVLLASNGETCVCRLATALGAPEFRISRHLGVMRASGLVKSRRQGIWMHYRLAKPRGRLEACLQDCFRDCLGQDAAARADRRRLPDEAAACRQPARGRPSGTGGVRPRALLTTTKRSPRAQD